MIDDSQHTAPHRGEPPRAPAQFELFCIHSYAGESGPPCAWRGPAAEGVRVPAGSAPRCPRCGRATLMPIAWPPSAPPPA